MMRATSHRGKIFLVNTRSLLLLLVQENEVKILSIAKWPLGGILTTVLVAQPSGCGFPQRLAAGICFCVGFTRRDAV